MMMMGWTIKEYHLTTAFAPADDDDEDQLDLKKPGALLLTWVDDDMTGFCYSNLHTLHLAQMAKRVKLQTRSSFTTEMKWNEQQYGETNEMSKVLKR